MRVMNCDLILFTRQTAFTWRDYTHSFDLFHIFGNCILVSHASGHFNSISQMHCALGICFANTEKHAFWNHGSLVDIRWQVAEVNTENVIGRGSGDNGRRTEALKAVIVGVGVGVGVHVQHDVVHKVDTLTTMWLRILVVLVVLTRCTYRGDICKRLYEQERSLRQ